MGLKETLSQVVPFLFDEDLREVLTIAGSALTATVIGLWALYKHRDAKRKSVEHSVATSDLPAEQVVQVSFHKNRGENGINLAEHENKHLVQSGLNIEQFDVFVHFVLTAVCDIKVINIDLRYGSPAEGFNTLPFYEYARPTFQRWVFNNSDTEGGDASYRLTRPRALSSKSPLDIKIARRFETMRGRTTLSGVLAIYLEMTSSEWIGVRVLEVTARMNDELSELRDLKLAWSGAPD